MNLGEKMSMPCGWGVGGGHPHGGQGAGVEMRSGWEPAACEC